MFCILCKGRILFHLSLGKTNLSGTATCHNIFWHLCVCMFVVVGVGSGVGQFLANTVKSVLNPALFRTFSVRQRMLVQPAWTWTAVMYVSLTRPSAPILPRPVTLKVTSTIQLGWVIWFLLHTQPDNGRSKMIDIKNDAHWLAMLLMSYMYITDNFNTDSWLVHNDSCHI